MTMNEENAVITEARRELDQCFAQGLEFVSKEPTLLFHYTSTEGLVGIVTQKKFFLSDMLAGFDQTEIRYGFGIVRQVLTEGPPDELVIRLLLQYEKDATLGMGDEMFVNAVCFVPEMTC